MNRSEYEFRDWLENETWVTKLAAPAKDRVMADSYELAFNQGALVARKGDVANAWMGVVEGLLKISAVQRSGKVVMFTCIPEGGWGGEGSVFKLEPRRYDIVAMRPSRVVFVPSATFRWLLDVSIEFNHVVLTQLNERLGQYIGMMEIDRLDDPVARVARCVGALFNPVLYPRQSTSLKISHTELGEFSGMSRQSVGAALKQLEVEGLIGTSYGGVVVHDLQALIRYEERTS